MTRPSSVPYRVRMATNGYVNTSDSRRNVVHALEAPRTDGQRNLRSYCHNTEAARLDRPINALDARHWVFTGESVTCTMCVSMVGEK